MSLMSQESRVEVARGVDLWMVKNPVEHPGAVLVIVHGLCEHAGRYDDSVDRFTGFGYSVYRFDNRGHGRSGGERGFIEDYNLFIEDADRMVGMARAENPGLPVFMLGHSMGGFITALYGVKHPGKLAGQILSGAATVVLPLFGPLEGLLDFDATPLAPIPNSLTDAVSRDPAVVKAYAEDPLVLRAFTTKLMGEVFLRGARTLMEVMGAYSYPCLILHGGADQIVTPEASRYFHDHISSKDKELKIYEGLYHEILNEPEKETVFGDIHQWIERHCPKG